MVGFIIFIIIIYIVISKKGIYKYNEGVSVTKLINLLKLQIKIVKLFYNDFLTFFLFP